MSISLYTLVLRVNLSIAKMLSLKLFSYVLIFLFLFKQIQSVPVEDSTKLSLDNSGELMETAESQNPFLPRFAMKKLKERREKARAQRRSQNAQRKINHPQKVDCPQKRYYKK